MKKGEQKDKMTAIKFKVKCPYEIGDKVKFEKAGQNTCNGDYGYFAGNKYKTRET